MSETTFGCGEFLPGRGPFNFPDYIDGGTVNNGDPPDPDPPGTKTEADPTDPPVVVDPPGDVPAPAPPPVAFPRGPTSPGPQVPAGSPSPGGPLSPGPQIPGAPSSPPNPKVCRCVVTTNGVSQTGPNTSFNGKISYSFTFIQRCTRVDPSTPDPTQATIEGYINDLIGSFQIPGGGEIIIEGALGFGDCNTGSQIAPRCNGTCAALQAFYTIPPPPPPPATGPPVITEEEEPPRPGPISPGPAPRGGGGGVTSAGPQSGAAPPVNPPFGGGEGGGPRSGTPIGPQAPGPGPSLPDGNAGNGGGGGTFIGTFPAADESPISNLVGGGILGRSSNNILTEITTELQSTSSIDLGDPAISREILAQRPAGFEEEEVFFDDTPVKSVLVRNTSNVSNLFGPVIDNNILYLLDNFSTFGDWDSRRAGGVTPDTVYASLSEETKSILSTILNYDRTPISKAQIYHLIGSRILDGTIHKVTKASLSLLAKGSDSDTPLKITRSRSDIVNETVALGLIERNYYPLSPEDSTGRAGETFKNQKTFSSDIDRYIPVIVNGEETRYYVNDDDTFIDRSTLSLQEGEYFDITVGGETSRLYVESEKDHAFLVPEKTRQIAINILGGDSSRTLTVSGDPSGIEVDYSLTSPRENIYFLSCVLDSVTTAPPLSNTMHIKNTTAKYEYVTLDNINQINEFIKYTNNHQTFIIDDEDRILDYVERDGILYLNQDDIIVESPKENKTIPILTRQIPRYILLYPTNNPEYNPFNAKSQIVNLTPSSSLDPGSVTRQLRTKTSIAPKFRNTFNQFVSSELVGRGGSDLFEQKTNQARINKINLDNKLINSGYIDSQGDAVAAASYVPGRSKTGYRLIYEIIKDLDNNYLLGLNGVGKSLTEFDVLSRLNLKQFNLLSRAENYNAIKQYLFNGAVSNVKITPSTKNSDSKIAIRKTQLVRRKSTAEAEDQFPEIKSTNFKRAIAPPTTEDPPTFVPFSPSTPPTALP